ncbi:IS630 family transposase [Nostoc sp. FACHB-888]|nr:IS630 family transposase [Nostoc sp. FACHB-888]
MHDERKKGNHQKVTKEYIELLMQIIEKEPSELGYEFGRWSIARLATYLAELTEIELSGEQVRKILEKKKYTYLWAKYSLEDKQDLEKREAFKAKLSGYLEASKQEPAKLQAWFWDETGFSLRVIRRKSWGKKGKRKKVTGQRSRDRIITGGKGGTVHLWNTSGQLLHNFQGALHKCGINWRLKPLKTRSKLSEIIP